MTDERRLKRQGPRNALRHGRDPGSAQGSESSDGGGGPPDQPPQGRSFPVVGLGASAGGLSALEQFFEHVPEHTGMAFVVITHQHSGQTSLLAELLQRRTAMPVVEVATATQLEPDHVYTTRPGFKLSVSGGVLLPVEVGEDGPLHMPVDYFFRALAQDQHERAIGIILSGTGSDGTLGLKEIKAELGMAMVQDEQSASYTGMPHSAIATELVDYVSPVPEMPAQLIKYAEALGPRHVAPARIEPSEEPLRQIYLLIRERLGHDFSHYKQTTVVRRVERRMNVHHIDDVKRYLRYMQANPVEIDQLFKELLIGVTSFFRDPDAWAALSQSLCALLASKPDDYVVRAWVPGCSTGEEAYSLAILMRECMEGVKHRPTVQIFATDLDAAAIERARTGLYPSGIANDLSVARLSRNFIQEDESYRVKKDIREMVVFAPQNLIADPPFTKLDVLCCRNLLIYLDFKLQKKLIPLFHYALRPNGLLFLGTSESISPYTELFSPVDKKWKVSGAPRPAWARTRSNFRPWRSR